MERVKGGGTLRACAAVPMWRGNPSCCLLFLLSLFGIIRPAKYRYPHRLYSSNARPLCLSPVCRLEGNRRKERGIFDDRNAILHIKTVCSPPPFYLLPVTSITHSRLQTIKELCLSGRRNTERILTLRTMFEKNRSIFIFKKIRFINIYFVAPYFVNLFHHSLHHFFLRTFFRRSPFSFLSTSLPLEKESSMLPFLGYRLSQSVSSRPAECEHTHTRDSLFLLLFPLFLRWFPSLAVSACACCVRL